MRWLCGVVSVVFAGAVVACGSDDEKPEVCALPAVSGATTTPSGEASYLLAVYSVPDGEGSAGNGETEYTLSFPAARLSTSSHPLRYRRSIAQPELDPSFAARSRFEQARHSKIDMLVNDLRSSKINLRVSEPRRVFARSTSKSSFKWPDGPETIQVDDCGSSVTKMHVYLDKNRPSGTCDEVLAVAGDFATTFSRELSILGRSSHSGALDRDGDGELTIVFTNQLGTQATLDVVGAFFLEDFLPAGVEKSTGNVADILWARIPGTSNTAGTITRKLIAGTLAHEYTHLFSYGVRVQEKNQNANRESSWLDEGLAHLMEDLTGWGASNIGTVNQALSQFDDGAAFAKPTDSQFQRGRAYMLLRHVIDMQARVAGSTSATDAIALTTAKNFVSSIIAEDARGFRHSAFTCESSELLWRSLLGTYATGDTTEITLGQAHTYDYLPVGIDATTSQKVGFNPHGQYTDARDNVVVLTGPDRDSLDENAVVSDEHLDDSGTHLYTLDGLDATLVTLVDNADPFLFVRAQLLK